MHDDDADAADDDAVATARLLVADIVDSREVERSAVERNFMINIDYLRSSCVERWRLGCSLLLLIEC